MPILILCFFSVMDKLQMMIAAIKANSTGTNSSFSKNLADMEYLVGNRNKGKGAIHLEGKFEPRGRHVCNVIIVLTTYFCVMYIEITQPFVTLYDGGAVKIDTRKNYEQLYKTII